MIPPLLLSALLGAAQATGTMSPTSDVSGNRVKATGSTTPRALRDRAADVVNVKDFGAVGDGVADDTAAIQAALNTGKTALVPAGTYKVTSQLQVPHLGGLVGTGINSVIQGSAIIGAVVRIGLGGSTPAGATMTLYATVRDIMISGTATTGLSVDNAQLIVVSGIRLQGTFTDGFRFRFTWASHFRDLSTAGSVISDNCFWVGDDFNANQSSNWYTSNFSAVNVKLDSAGSASHGSSFSNITLQGGTIGLWVRSYQGANFDGVYEENTGLAVRLGDESATAALARAITIRNLNTTGAAGSNPGWATRGPLIDFDRAAGCSIISPDFGGAYGMALAAPVTITGTGGSGAKAIARVASQAGVWVVHSVEMLYGGSGYSTASVSFGGSGSSATATATLTGGVVTAISVTNGGSGYAPLQMPVVARYHTSYRNVIISPYLNSVSGGVAYANPVWPWVVRKSGAPSDAGIQILGDVSWRAAGDAFSPTAELRRAGGYGYMHYVIETDASGLQGSSIYVPPEYPGAPGASTADARFSTFSLPVSIGIAGYFVAQNAGGHSTILRSTNYTHNDVLTSSWSPGWTDYTAIRVPGNGAGSANDQAVVSATGYVAALTGLQIGQTTSGGVTITLGTAAPVSGTWVQGSRVLNSSATVGQPKGWICTVGGTPGTWVSEGNL
jgi:hypothetical protein